MLTLDTLVGLTDKRVSAVLSKYRMGSLQMTETSGSYRYDAIIYGGHKPARSVIEAEEKNVRTPCRVSCTCEYFAMNLETVLALHGNTRVASGEGIIPIKKNPALKPGLCPHLFYLALHLGKQWTSTDEDIVKDVNTKVRERDISDLPNDDN